ncbi:transposase, partial [Ferrimicrobium acidiphilum]|uniref:transposase n=1 Tax=Ferrimicrobium acidiphilum TaxID=121039 RepID=UPI0023F03251
MWEESSCWAKFHTPDQVIAKLAEGDRMLNEGKTIAEVARSACLTETSWHRWKNTYGGMKASDATRLKELEAENRRLKLMVADLTLDKAMLKEEGFRETSNPQIAVVAC